jgi:CRP-like cAMP-binding protein
MARRDVSTVRDEAARAVERGKWRQALELYGELERLQPTDAAWSKRVGELHRRLGQDREAIAAFERAVERYVGAGFVVQGVAVCKLILQIDPNHVAAVERIAGHATRPTQAIAAVTPGFAASRPSSELAATEFDEAAEAPPRADAPGLPMPWRRARSERTTVPPGAPLDTVSLAAVVPGAQPVTRADGRRSGVTVIPLEQLDAEVEVEIDVDGGASAGGGATTELETVDLEALEPGDPGGLLDVELELGAAGRTTPVDVPPAPPGYDLDDAVVEVEVDLGADDPGAPTAQDDAAELELEVELADQPPAAAAAAGASSSPAHAALRAAPLLAGLPPRAMEQLVARLSLVLLPPNDPLFHEGDPGLAMYVVADGEVVVESGGSELARLGPGAFVGEVALVTDLPRSATVRAGSRPVELLEIDREVVSDLVNDHPGVLEVLLRFVRDRLVDRVVRTSALFAPFEFEDRVALSARFELVEIELGERIIVQGERAEGLYVVLAGQAGVWREPHPEQVVPLGPGEVFGEISMLSGDGAIAHVDALTRVLALRLPIAAFQEVMMTHPQVLAFVADLAGRRAEAVGDELAADRKLELL